MDSESSFPLDITDFRCTAISRSSVVVVFAPTERRYTYPWHHGELGLAKPTIDGPTAPHAPEVIDCLARAVAYKAVQDAGGYAAICSEPVVSRKTAALLQAGWTALRLKFATHGVRPADRAPPHLLRGRVA